MFKFEGTEEKFRLEVLLKFHHSNSNISLLIFLKQIELFFRFRLNSIIFSFFNFFLILFNLFIFRVSFTFLQYRSHFSLLCIYVILTLFNQFNIPSINLFIWPFSTLMFYLPHLQFLFKL